MPSKYVNCSSSGLYFFCYLSMYGLRGIIPGSVHPVKLRNSVVSAIVI